MTLARLEDAYAGARVLVTGDTGFKGAWLALWLHRLGARVVGASLPAAADSLSTRLRLSALIDQRVCDIRDAAGLAALVDDVAPEFVFHLAAQALVRRSYAAPQETFATNLLGSVNLLEALRRQPAVRALVYVTSDKAYRNHEWPWGYRENDALGGRDPYSASKACAELALEAYRASWFDARPGFGAASARAGNVIGGGDRAEDRIVPDAVRALEDGRPLLLRNPTATRPWQHVLDCLHGYLLLGARLAAAPERHAGAWNFGPDDGDIRPVRTLARAFLAAWGGGDLREAPEADAPHEATVLHLDSGRARRELGWRPVWAFDEAVANTAAWHRATHDGADPRAVTLDQIAAFSAALVGG